MKERPILFSAEMVRTILEGRKNQTRRVVNAKWLPLVEECLRVNGKWVWHTTDYDLTTPYGHPGDRLWLRESWAPFYLDGAGGCKHMRYHFEANAIRYAASPDAVVAYPRNLATRWTHPCPADIAHSWRPSIHMPRWASRITLEITGIRVERLQDISEADALAEGIYEDAGGKFQKSKGNGPYCETARQAYQFLWQDINGAESWAANPWLWVIEFKRVEK